MHAENETTGSIHCEKSDDKITSMEVLIIGFGFSAIPLIRELERDGINYAVVSNGEGSIWDRLEKHGRLDFDLVSSVHSSLYSFELVKSRCQRSLSDIERVPCFHQKVSDPVQLESHKGLGDICRESFDTLHRSHAKRQNF